MTLKNRVSNKGEGTLNSFWDGNRDALELYASQKNKTAVTTQQTDGQMQGFRRQDKVSESGGEQSKSCSSSTPYQVTTRSSLLEMDVRPDNALVRTTSNAGSNLI